MNMINKTLTISACALLLTAGQTTLAEPSVGTAPDPSPEFFSAPTIEQVATPGSFDPATATVSYSDLNLESEEGVREVYRLLQRASKEVCTSGTARQGRSVIMKSSRLQCYRESLSNAVENIDNENLTRFHAG
jgi:UrcA family protein